VTRKKALVQPIEMPKPAAARGENRASEQTLLVLDPARLPASNREASAPAPELPAAEMTLAVPSQPLWELDIAEITGHNLEARGREEVNRMLGEGWRLLHIYTLRYQQGEVWRERPMAILGRPRTRDELAVGSEAAAAKGGPHENPARRG
jgi:hypothetical protein